MLNRLSIDDLTYLQGYLEQVKNKKLAGLQSQLQPAYPQSRATDFTDPISRPVPVDWRTFSPSAMRTPPDSFSWY